MLWEREKMVVSSIFAFAQNVLQWLFVSLETLNVVINEVLSLSKTSPCFFVSAVGFFENTVGKGEIARNEQFLLFPQFSTLLENFSPFSSNLKIVVYKLFQFGNELN